MYGRSNSEAINDEPRNAMMVARIAAQNISTSMNPPLMFFLKKNSQDHVTFNTSWIANMDIGMKADDPSESQTSHTDIAMRMYSIDQTGPKAQSGGFQEGFLSPRYQLWMLRVVNIPPIPAAAKQTANDISRAIQSVM